MLWLQLRSVLRPCRGTTSAPSTAHSLLPAFSAGWGLLAAHHPWLAACLAGRKCWPLGPSGVLHPNASAWAEPSSVCKVTKRFHTVQTSISKTRLVPDNLTSLFLRQWVRTEEPEARLAFPLPSPPQPCTANRQVPLCPGLCALSPRPSSCSQGWQHCWENADCAGLDAGVGNYRRFVG